MNKTLNVFLSTLLACSLFDQSDQRAHTPASPSRTIASIPFFESDAVKAERIKLREAGRRCERGERCTQAILVADRLGLYDIGIRYARLDCERSGRPCFMAGHLAAKAQYNDETIFWNIVDSCTQSIDGVPCNAFKAEGYQEQTFFELLSMRVGRTTVEELIFPQTN